MISENPSSNPGQDISRNEPLPSIIEENYPDEPAINLLPQQSNISTKKRIRKQFSKEMGYSKNQLSKRLKRMYKFPASYTEALVHKKAYKNGFKTAYSLKDGSQQHSRTLLCPCCQNFVNTIDIPFNYHTYPKKLYNSEEEKKILRQSNGIKSSSIDMKSNSVFQIQAGDALFFCFVKLLITYLCFRFLFVDVYVIYSNYQGTYCRTNPQLHAQGTCNTPWVDLLSTPNKNNLQGQPFFFVSNILGLIFTLLSMVYFMYGRIKLYQLYEMLESWDVTEDDYTILIQDIPLIPYEGNDARVRDVNKDYQTFVKKTIQKKIRVWLNKFYTFGQSHQSKPKQIIQQNINPPQQKQSDSKDNSQDIVEKQFYTDIYHNLKLINKQTQLYDNIVSNINLCYDLTQLQNLEIFRQKLIDDFILTQGKEIANQRNLFDDQLFLGSNQIGHPLHNQADQYVSYVPQQVDIINRHYIKVCQRISEIAPVEDGISGPSQLNSMLSDRYDTSGIDNLKISRFVGKAFVSLKYQHFKVYLLDRYRADQDFIKVNGNQQRLKLTQAAKPNDVYWNNMKISDEFRQKQIRNSYFLVAISIFVSGLMIAGLTFLKTIFSSTGGKVTIFQEMYIYILPMFTFTINTLLDWALHEFNKYQRHQSKTNQLSSLVIKNVASKFFNTAFIYAIVYIIGPKVNFLNQNGIVYIITSLVVESALLNIVYQYLQPYELYLKYYYYKDMYQSIERGQDRVNLFQMQLNDIIEDPHFPYDVAYSYYLQMMFIMSFYGYLIPMITPILLIAFIAQYWLDKYNLLRRYSSPIDLGYFLTDLIWKAFQSTLLLQSLGHLVWSYYLHLSLSELTVFIHTVTFLLSVAYLVVVIGHSNQVYEFIQNKKLTDDKIYGQSYEAAHHIFSKTYQSYNPATAFIVKKDTSLQDLIGRVTTYSMDMMQKRSKFVSPLKEEQVKILNNTKDQTTILVDLQQNQSQKVGQDFSTIFCFL